MTSRGAVRGVGGSGLPGGAPPGIQPYEERARGRLLAREVGEPERHLLANLSKQLELHCCCKGPLA